MGRVLAQLEALDRRLQAAPPHPLLGSGSLHASMVAGGQEWSSYPDRCTLQVERRTIPGEPADCALREVTGILEHLCREDAELEADVREVFGRGPYEIDPASPLSGMVTRAAVSIGCTSRMTGLSFWSDAAILSTAGIPTVLFGPGGAGLHSTEEYVRIGDVLTCRDVLIELARAFARAR
jgi:acetylornithine deacetylase